jgi:uncharacterized sulfatase
VPHAVRAIYAGLLGWYDGNPTTLNPLEPKRKAQKMAEQAIGGTPQLTEQMKAALAITTTTNGRWSCRIM